MQSFRALLTSRETYIRHAHCIQNIRRNRSDTWRKSADRLRSVKESKCKHEAHEDVVHRALASRSRGRETSSCCCSARCISDCDGCIRDGCGGGCISDCSDCSGYARGCARGCISDCSGYARGVANRWRGRCWTTTGWKGGGCWGSCIRGTCWAEVDVYGRASTVVATNTHTGSNCHTHVSSEAITGAASVVNIVS